jgi:alpha-L-fucosidase
MKRLRLRWWPCCIVAVSLLPIGVRAADRPDRAAWMRDARLGVMTHYLADWIARRDDPANRTMGVARWNELVDHFDVEALATQVESVGAKYLIFTIGQNSGYYCSPNGEYDRIVGHEEGHCSKRDLIADLSVPLHRRGIRLIAYLPAGAPSGDRVARDKLQWQSGPHANREFQRHWEAIIRQWSTRWGTNVDGWWFDGCYWPNTMYRDEAGPNFATFAAAARAGNAASVVAFNPGVVYRTLSITPHEDYIAGEIDQPERQTIRRVVEGRVDGTRLHMLSYLGTRWGTAPARFTAEQAIAFTRPTVNAGGCVTWDVPIQNDGTIAKEYLERLRAVSDALKQPATAPSTHDVRRGD